MACITIGTKNINVMLFKEATFSGFTKNKTADTSQVTEVLFSFDAESRDEVDEMAKKAADAGGNLFLASPVNHRDGCMVAPLPILMATAGMFYIWI